MKKRYNLLLNVLAILLITMVFIPQSKAIASTKPKKLKANTNYSYDLNGDGKKEKIKYTEKIYKKYNSEYNYEYIEHIKYSLYINDKVVYSYDTKSVKSDDIWEFMNVYTEKNIKKVASLSIVDIDTRDKYLNLIFEMTDWRGIRYVAIQRYDGNKIINMLTAADLIKLDKNDETLFYGFYNFDGKGNFLLSGSPLFKSGYLGNVYNSCEVPFILKGNKIVKKDTSVYSLGKDTEEELAVNITMYKDAKKTSAKVRTIKKGERVYLLKAKPNGSGGVYVYIKDKNENKGWIYIPNESMYFEYNSSAQAPYGLIRD